MEFVFCLSEYGSDTFLRNVGSYKIHTASYPRRRIVLFCYHITHETCNISYVLVPYCLIRNLSVNSIDLRTRALDTRCVSIFLPFCSK
jgi:hypothetical protein